MRSPGAGGQATLTADEAAYALASLLAGADGTVTHAESRKVEAEWSRYAAARKIAPAEARRIAEHCRSLRATLGAPALLAACERTLRTAPDAREAVLMAVQVASTDGKLAAGERAHLERLMTLVGLTVDQLPRRLRSPDEGS